MINTSDKNNNRLAASRNSTSDRSALIASLKAAIEADGNLDASIRHSENIGAMPPKLMSGQRELYEAKRLLASAILHLKESCVPNR